MTLPLITPIQSDVLTSLRGFLLFVLPFGTDVIEGLNNRVPGPIGPDYVVMTPITMKRLETNVDLYADCAFVGYTDGVTTLTVLQLQHGAIVIGHQLYPTSMVLAPALFVSAPLRINTDGTGTYTLSGSAPSLPTQTMASGVLFAMQPTEVCVQLDVYGPNSFANSQIISTLFRDDFAIESFTSLDVPAPPQWQDIPSGGTISVPYNGIRPLYADDPRQMTQIFGEMQYELRWTVDAYLQANMIVTAPQQFAGTVNVHPLIEVDTGRFSH
jgi:hypothetical protein